MHVIILGCGPAGLMAAAGAALGGADRIQIVSNKRKSDMFGAQYLHQPIPHFTDKEQSRRIKYVLRGDADAYRTKVYGPMWDGTVSPEDLSEEHSAWDIRETYDRLWEEFSPAIIDMEVKPYVIQDLLTSCDLLISSIPGPAICTEGHTFRGRKIWAAGEAPERGILLPYDCAPDTVICNGEESPSWYRLSNIFDRVTVEWPGEMRMPPPVRSAAEVTKPLGHNCSCWPDVKRVGRYGAWRKGVLSHEAFHDAFQYTEDGIS